MHLWHQIPVLDVKAWPALIHPKGGILLGGLCAGWSSSSTPNPLFQSFMALVHKVIVVLEEEGGHPQNVYKMVQVLFTRSAGPSLIPEKQLYTRIPPPLNFTLGTMQSDNYCSVCDPGVSIGLPDREAWFVTLRTCLHRSRIQWLCNMVMYLLSSHCDFTWLLLLLFPVTWYTC